MKSNYKNINFDNTYVKLPDRFYSKTAPVPVKTPSVVIINKNLSKEIDIDYNFLCSDLGVNILAGNNIPCGSDPISLVYAGHQFGNWVPLLGDGRAILLGEIKDKNGLRKDIQLKGSGITPFSRSGDGRAWLGPVIREYIVSEAMAALNINTTRSLSAILTGEEVIRERNYPGAILTRIASSHVRVGTFQYFSFKKDYKALKLLADYIIDRCYPDIKNNQNPYLSLIESVMRGQASLVAKWMGVGFIHGVMNTDNFSISCETIDYGPCAFMDKYESAKVFSSIDVMGRYSYKNQPNIAMWNLGCLVSSLLPLISTDQNLALKKGRTLLESFPDIYYEEWLNVFRKKLGLVNFSDNDHLLINSFLGNMEKYNTDFTMAFRSLKNFGVESNYADINFKENYNIDFFKSEEMKNWLMKWRKAIGERESSIKKSNIILRKNNPAFIARNHNIQNIIDDLLENNSSSLVDFLHVLKNPYEENDRLKTYKKPPLINETINETFCGT